MDLVEHRYYSAIDGKGVLVCIEHGCIFVKENQTFDTQSDKVQRSGAEGREK
jgi:hypothetical protein